MEGKRYIGIEVASRSHASFYRHEYGDAYIDEDTDFNGSVRNISQRLTQE